MKKFFLSANVYFLDISLLILRLVFGGMMIAQHGWSKIQKIGTLKGGFPSIWGMGSEVSLYLTIFAEFVCAAFLILGLFTRLSIIPLLTTMLVAIFVVHINDGLGKMELAILYASAYLFLLFTGPGKISVDHLIKV